MAETRTKSRRVIAKAANVETGREGNTVSLCKNEEGTKGTLKLHCSYPLPGAPTGSRGSSSAEFTPEAILLLRDFLNGLPLESISKELAKA